MEFTNRVEECMSDFVKCFNCIENGGIDINVLQCLISSLKTLRNSCSEGYEAQCKIIKIFPNIFRIVEENLLSQYDNISSKQKDEFNLLTWQLMANLTVHNGITQQIIWENYGTKIKQCLSILSTYTDIQLFILYNIKKGNTVYLDPKEIFSILLKTWSSIMEIQHEGNMEYLHIFFEEYLCNISCPIVSIYATLETAQRIVALKYIATYLRNDSINGHIQKHLMEFISKEFKMKSDCILRVNDERLSQLYPYEVLMLIEVISIASGDVFYSHLYEGDHPLFFNVGALLQGVNEIGRKTNNIFTPMEKLVQVAPNSKIDASFENAVSFQLRTYLVRTLANLLYKNKTNQDYSREMNIIPAILDSTRVDARNPLIKEWSLLAIRNLCENCPENQKIISNLTKIGDVSNDSLKELNLEMGSLRINPKD